MVDARNIRVSESKEGAGVLIRTLRRSTQPIMVPKVGDLCLVSTVRRGFEFAFNEIRPNFGNSCHAGSVEMEMER